MRKIVRVSHGGKEIIIRKALINLSKLPGGYPLEIAWPLSNFLAAT